MKINFEHKNAVSPKVSIVLLDWSCRESFHILDYLGQQTLPREQYEIIWIEYYSRFPEGIKAKISKSKELGLPPCINKFITLGMPENIYYHKHLMYNLGIIAANGEILVFCDSDAVVTPKFTENIAREFEKDLNIVLHLDQVRNVNRKFFPFNNPTIEQIISEGSKNFINGRTLGILDQEDILHTRNYGACMSAKRKDLIKIGGADEHVDYLGHICGPYEMSFRLVNSGLRELWHQEEYLYHTWHPGTDGQHNYFGPHDGRNMSTTALEIRRSGRIKPLVENKAVKTLRENGKNMPLKRLLELSISGIDTKIWSMDRIKRMQRFKFLSSFKISLRNLKLKFLILNVILLMIMKQSRVKTKVQAENKVMPKGVLLKLRMAFAFIRRMWRNNVYSAGVCNQVIQKLVSDGIKDAVIYGKGEIANILSLIAKKFPLSVAEIEDLRGYKGKVIIASFTGITEKVNKLREVGIEENNIVRLQ